MWLNILSSIVWVQMWYIYVEPLQRYWRKKIEKKIVYKMTARGWTEVASDVKFGIWASFTKLYPWSKFGDPTLTVSQRRCLRDGDDDGVRGLSHKRLRQGSTVKNWCQTFYEITRFLIWIIPGYHFFIFGNLRCASNTSVPSPKGIRITQQRSR